MTLVKWPATVMATALAILPFSMGAARADGTLTVALAADDGSWDPIDTFTLNWGRIGSNLFDALILRDTELNLLPGLATSWEMMDDNKRIRFTLRQGVTFHNGEPFNAAAVQYSFERLLGEEGAKGPQQANYTAISGVEIVDDYTVDLVLSQSDPVLLTKLAGYGAMIVPPEYIKANGEEYFNLNPVGTGPFRFVEYQPRISLTLEANPDYWGGAPQLDGLVYRFIPEASTQVSELQSGGIDIATLVPISLISTIAEDPNLRVESVTGPGVETVRFDITQGITQDVAVRLAIIKAIDRDAIIAQILQGNGQPIASLQSSLSFGYDPNLAPLPFDPAAAKAALEAAGVPEGAEVGLSFVGDDATFREVAQTIAAYLSGVGLNVSLNSYESNAYYSDVIPNGTTGEMFEFNWGGWTFDFDNTAYLLYHSDQYWNPFIADPALDALLDQQRASSDVEERRAILQQVARYAAEQAYEIPLYNLNTIYALNRRVGNLPPTPDVRFRFLETTVE
jgi:peptide/nickel transport system substrate-binding protein